MLAVGYGRVSTSEQGQEERFSLPHQQEHIRQECAVREWELVGYFEDTESGKSTKKRKGFAQALSLMAKADVLIVHELDRLSRNLIDTLMIADDLHKQGKKFVSIHDNIDSSNDQGELQMHILAVFAHYFRKQLGRKVHGGMSTKARAGEWNTKPPFGYRLDNKHLSIDESEAWIVRKIFELYLNHNLGMRNICIELNSMALKTRAGVPWQSMTVKKILQNRVYAGDTVWNKGLWLDGKYKKRPPEEWITAEGTHSAIIEKATWIKAQERIKRKAELPPRAQSNAYLLSGVLRCGSCGGSMIGRKYRGRSGKIYYHYGCEKYYKSGLCEKVSITCAELDKRVKDYIIGIVGPAEQDMPVDTAEIFNAVDKKRELEAAENQLAFIPGKRDKQMQLLESGRITDDEFDRARARIVAEEKELKEKTNSLRRELSQVNEVDMLKKYLSDWRKALNNSDINTQKSWIQNKIKAIHYRRDGGLEIDFNTPLL